MILLNTATTLAAILDFKNTKCLTCGHPNMIYLDIYMYQKESIKWLLTLQSSWSLPPDFYILWVKLCHCGAYQCSVVTALDVELAVAQTPHKFDEHSRSVGNAESWCSRNTQQYQDHLKYIQSYHHSSTECVGSELCKLSYQGPWVTMRVLMASNTCKPLSHWSESVFDFDSSILTGYF